MLRRRLILALVLTACSSSTRTSTGRTERERDSVIGQSQVPGAAAVQKSLDTADSLRARTAIQDSIGAGIQ
jgi:hypothetical protein